MKSIDKYIIGIARDLPHGEATKPLVPNILSLGSYKVRVNKMYSLKSQKDIPRLVGSSYETAIWVLGS